MIQSIMLVALGFLLATLISLLLAPSLWRRAARLTTRRLEQSMPMSIADIEADRDQLRASYAIMIRRLEAALSQEKMLAARYLVQISRLQMDITNLKEQVAGMRSTLDAHHNAAIVLQRTIATRVPELDRAASQAYALLDVRDKEIRMLVNRLKRREEDLAIVHRTTEMQQSEIARLRQSMEMSGAQNSGRFKKRPSKWTIHDYRSEYDRLNVELSKMRERLAVAYDREANQINVLKTELQQLAERITTSAKRVDALPEGKAPQAGPDTTSHAGLSTEQGKNRLRRARAWPYVPLRPFRAGPAPPSAARLTG
jgi:chromosome segregation ATPase